MDRKEIFELIQGTLVQIQEMSGREVLEITPKTIPIGGLPGFDSLRGLEFSIMIPPELRWNDQNVCVSRDGRKALSIKEMIDLILEHNPSNEENSL